MKKHILLFLFVLAIAFPAIAGSKVPPNWKSWDNFPDVTRIEASMVADLLTKGEEKIVFIYAGYKKTDVICSSIFLPYNQVPPFGSGATINLADIPKDTMMVAY